MQNCILGGGASRGNGVEPSGTSGGRTPTGGSQLIAGCDDYAERISPSGGFGYIGVGRIYSPSTITGFGNSGNDSAIITLIKKSLQPYILETKK